METETRSTSEGGAGAGARGREIGVEDLMVTVAPGVRLHARRSGGTPGRSTFLLVHGLSSNARLWDEVAAILVRHGRRAIAVDLRSHGESDAPEAGYDTATAAADLAALAAELGMVSDGEGRAVVAGQSWGGNVAVRFAAEHPEFVAALALVDGGWGDMRSGFRTWEAAERALRPPEIDGVPAAAMRERMRAGHPRWSDAAVDATLANLAVRPDGTVARRLSIPHHMAIVRSMWDEPPRAYFPSIHVPVLLMPALPEDSDDAQGARKRDLVSAAAEALHDAEIRGYPGGDHDLHAQQPERVAADLLDLAGRVG